MNTTLMRLAAGAACLAAAGAYAYDRANVTNRAPWPATVTVKYAACKTDTFTVPGSTKDKTGTATAPTNRGACLITSVSATLQGKSYPVTSYTSSGTSYSLFVIWYSSPITEYMGGTKPAAYRINSKQELGSGPTWLAAVGSTASPEGDYGYPLGTGPKGPEHPH